MRIKWKERCEAAEHRLEMYANYHNAYDGPRGTCKNCGEFLHSGYCCAHCGQDPTDPERNVKER